MQPRQQQSSHEAVPRAVKSRRVTLARAMMAVVIFAASMIFMTGTASANCPIPGSPQSDLPQYEHCNQGTPAPTYPPYTPTPKFDRVVALGDSYGAGTGYYSVNSNYENKDCLRTDNSHAGQIADHLNADLQNLACYGAVTGSVYGQLGDVNIAGTGDGTLITLTIGGNNIRAGTIRVGGWLGALAAYLDINLINSPLAWGEVVGLCLVVSRCDRVNEFQETNLAVTGTRVQAVYETILDTYPDATLKVMSYPEIMQRSPWCHGVTGIGRQEADWLDENARALNMELRDAVNAARTATGGDIELVSVAKEFDDRGACRMSWNRYIHDATPLFGNTIIGINKAFHPNKKGYDAFYRALKSAL